MKVKLSSELIESSIDLSEFGMNTLIWEISQISNVLDRIECKKNLVILGGDIYRKEADRYLPNGDGWYYNGENIHEAMMKSRNYLDNYSERNGNNFFVGLVIKEI